MARHKLGQKLAKEMKASDVNQTQLAKMLSLKSRSTISKWLSGENVIGGDNLNRVCERLGLDNQTVNELMNLAIQEWPQDAHDYERFKMAINESVEVSHKPHIPDPETDMYFELNLGEEVKEEQKRPDNMLVALPNEFPMAVWAENEDKWRRKLQVKPSQEVLDDLLTKQGLHVIVGEPGAGKTTLLRKLGKSLLEQDSVVPMFVSLREVSEEGIVAYFEKQKKKYNLKFDAQLYINGDVPEGQTVIWVFDGWDELSRPLQKQWKKLIEDQSQHTCILTCRNAQYNNDFGKPYYLMGLNPDEQKEFLEQLSEVWKIHPKYEYDFAEVTLDWIDELHTKLQENEQLKRLAGSPLLLTLIAQTNSPKKGIELPLKRLEFYRKAFASLIQQRDDEIDGWSPEPQKLQSFLAEVGFITNQDGINAEFDINVLHSLSIKHSISKIEFKLLQRTGILKILHERCQWLHLTFAEWLLAESWKEQGLSLVDAIKKHFAHPDYDEALTLLWSASSSEHQTIAIDYLIKAGTVASRKEYGKSRSALKTLVRLYTRSGTNHTKEQFYQLWSQFTEFSLRRYALANTENLIDAFMQELANDKNPYVRESIASKDNLPESILEGLASDNDIFVREAIARRYILSDKILEKLASDDDSHVREVVTRRDNLSDNLVKKLASDKNPYVRERIAARNSVFDNIIEKSSSDKTSDVFKSLGLGENLPKNFLWDITVQHSLSSNILEGLLNNATLDLRRKIAVRNNLSDTLIEKLASDEDSGVRRSIAKRNDLSNYILEKLASDENSNIRREIAQHPDVCWEWLTN